MNRQVVSGIDPRELARRSVHLALVDIDERELEEFIKEIEKLMTLVKRLDEIDLRDVEPMFYVWDRTEVLRDDEVHDYGEEIMGWLERSSRVENRYVKGPRTVEER